MAWGRRGVANHSDERAVACDISAMLVAATVRELMDWAGERRRAELVADAHRTIGLEMSNHRPPWWWFLAIDPSGARLRRLAETATMRFEPFGMMV